VPHIVLQMTHRVPFERLERRPASQSIKMTHQATYAGAPAHLLERVCVDAFPPEELLTLQVSFLMLLQVSTPEIKGPGTIISGGGSWCGLFVRFSN
jgi:hypothetical protein